MTDYTPRDPVVLSDRVIADIVNLRDIRREIHALRDRESEARRSILDALAGSSVGITASGVQAVIVQEQHRIAVDRKKLEALYPDVFKDVIGTKVVQVVTLP